MLVLVVFDKSGLNELSLERFDLLDMVPLLNLEEFLLLLELYLQNFDFLQTH